MKSIPLDSHHFSMTKPKDAEAQEVAQLEDLIRGKLSYRLSQETLLQRWIQSSEVPQDALKDPNPRYLQRASDFTDISKSTLHGKKTSLSQEDDVKTGEHQQTDNAAEQTYWSRQPSPRFNYSEMRDWIDRLMGTGYFPATAFRNAEMIMERSFWVSHTDQREKIEFLDIIFALYGDQIPITQELVEFAAKDTDIGADFLDLLLVMRGDQIKINEQILIAAISNTGDQVAVIDLLISRYGDEVPITEEVAKIAAGIFLTAKRIEASALLLRAANHKRVCSASFIEVLLQTADFGHQLLLWAAHQDVETFKLLLKSNFNIFETVGEDGKTPLTRAIAEKQENIVKLLVDSGRVDVNTQDKGGYTPLSTAITEKQENIVKLLIESGNVHVNAKDGYGHSPLSRAISENQENMVNLLLKTDQINVNAKTTEGFTPLLYCVKKSRDGIVKALLDKGGVSVDEVTRTGQTALSWAAEWGQKTVVGYLLNEPVINVNSEDNQGRTPLFFAVDEGHDEIVNLLLERDGLDVDIKFDGETPLQQAERLKGKGTEAERLKREHIVQLLRDRGKRSMLAK